MSWQFTGLFGGDRSTRSCPWLPRGSNSLVAAWSRVVSFGSARIRRWFRIMESRRLSFSGSPIRAYWVTWIDMKDSTQRTCVHLCLSEPKFCSWTLNYGRGSISLICKSHSGLSTEIYHKHTKDAEVWSQREYCSLTLWSQWWRSGMTAWMERARWGRKDWEHFESEPPCSLCLCGEISRLTALAERSAVQYPTESPEHTDHSISSPCPTRIRK